MAEGDLGPDFLLEWAGISQAGVSGDHDEHSPSPASESGRGSCRRRVSLSSRLLGESEERRERRLKQARECSSRRRSTETPEQREKRLKEQRERMAMKRRTESPETREARSVAVISEGGGRGLLKVRTLK